MDAAHDAAREGEDGPKAGRRPSPRDVMGGTGKLELHLSRPGGKAPVQLIDDRPLTIAQTVRREFVFYAPDAYITNRQVDPPCRIVSGWCACPAQSLG
jgi:hypothetical protein